MAEPSPRGDAHAATLYAHPRLRVVGVAADGRDATLYELRPQRIPLGALTPSCLSIFLYRVEPNKAMRAAWSEVSSRDGVARLPLDLHYMPTPWASDPELEHRILGRAMQCLDTTPVLAGPLLTPAGAVGARRGSAADWGAPIAWAHADAHGEFLLLPPDAIRRRPSSCRRR